MCVKTARLWERRDQGGASREGKAVYVSKQRGYGREETRVGHPGKARQYVCQNSEAMGEKRPGWGIQGRQGSMCVKTARLWESREQGRASREGKAVCV